MTDQPDARKSALDSFTRENLRAAPKPAASVSAGAHAIVVNGNVNVITMGESSGSLARRPERSRPPHNRKSWRAEMEGAIWERAWNLNMTGDQVLELAAAQVRRSIESLVTLSQHELDVLYETIARMRRPAIE